MRILANNVSGSVGIGIIAPEAFLHILTPNGSPLSQLQLGNGNQPTREWGFFVDGVSDLSLKNENTGVPFTAMKIQNTGIVQLNTYTTNGIVKTSAGNGTLIVGSINLTTEVTGILPVVNGGTGSNLGAWLLGGNAPGGASILGTTDNSVLNINSGTGAMNIGTDANNVITLGTTGGASTLAFNAGTGNTTITTPSTIFQTQLATNDQIKISPFAGGGAGFAGNITSVDLTAPRTWVFPDASGTVLLSTTGWSTTGNTGTVAGTNYIGTNDVQDLVIKTSAVAGAPLERVRVLASNGNVGIGTSAPGAMLTVLNSNNVKTAVVQSLVAAPSAPTTIISSNYLQLGQGEYGVGSYRLIGFGFNSGLGANSPAYMGYQETALGAVTMGDLVFGTRDVTTNTQASERMRITSAGLVGIGTNSPTAMLTVLNSNSVKTAIVQSLNSVATAPTTIINSNYLQLGQNEFGANSYRLIGFGFNSGLISNSPAYIGYQEAPVVAGVTKGDLVFGTRDVTTNTQASERMRISSAGVVSIPLGGLLDLSAMNNSSIATGLLLPKSTDNTAAITEGQMGWDSDDNVLTVGTGTVARNIGIPNGMAVLTTASVSPWVHPVGVQFVWVKVWGGGGGGNRSAGNKGGGGGGGGAYSESLVDISGSASNTFIVGAGGAMGMAGGPSSFNGGIIVSANGGQPGAGTTGAGAGGIISGAGALQLPGGIGGVGGNNGNSSGGAGGGSPFGGAGGSPGSGHSNNSAQQIGGAGASPGGGGGGGGEEQQPSNGGAGAAGLIIIYW